MHKSELRYERNIISGVYKVYSMCRGLVVDGSGEANR